MDRKIQVVTEVVLALVFVVLCSTIFSHVYRFGKRADSQLASIEAYSVQAELEPYNDTVVSGDVVISTINKLKETRDGVKMHYTVKNSGNTSNYGYATTGYSYTTYATSTDATSNKFINPVANYDSKITRNANGVVTGITFTIK